MRKQNAELEPPSNGFFGTLLLEQLQIEGLCAVIQWSQAPNPVCEPGNSAALPRPGPSKVGASEPRLPEPVLGNLRKWVHPWGYLLGANTALTLQLTNILLLLNVENPSLELGIFLFWFSKW